LCIILLFKPYDAINYFIPAGYCIKISSGSSRKSPAGCRKLSEFPEKPLRGCDKLSGVPEKPLRGCDKLSGRLDIIYCFQPGFSSILSALLVANALHYVISFLRKKQFLSKVHNFFF